MTYGSINIEEILRSYEKNRLNNKRLLQERREEIYALIPRIEVIDSSSKMSYIEAAKKRALGIAAAPDTPADKQRLKEEKASLLKQHGYPEDYLEPIYTCPICKDTGYVEADSSNTAPVKKCSCFTDQIVSGLYIQSNLSRILEKENFDTFDLSYYSTQKNGQQYSPHENISSILKKSKEFASGFDSKTENRGNILIYGETGMGKTFLTNCIAKELLDNGHSVLYLSANELFEKVLGGFVMKEQKELEDLYRFVYNSELLIIDDLGTELTNNFVLSQLFELINRREISGLSTLISTNLTVSQLSERYGERIMSRIVANYTVFYMYGDNIRYQKRKNAINKNS